MLALGLGLAIVGNTQEAAAQVVLVDVGIGTPGLGARVIWGAPPPVVVAPPPVVIVEPEPVFVPAHRVVYYEYWPVTYWEYVRAHDPYRYARFRAWRDYERDYRHAWRVHDRARLEQLRVRQARYFGERAAAEREYRAWKMGRDHDDGRGRGRGRGRGHR
jgi:hypothetical protein